MQLSAFRTFDSLCQIDVYFQTKNIKLKTIKREVIILKIEFHDTVIRT